MTKISYYNHTFLDEMRQQTDPLADAAVQAVYNSGASGQQLRTVLGALNRNSDPLPAGLPAPVSRFFEISSQLPAWADAKRMQAGSRFFALHKGDLMLMLGMLSLPYDYAAVKGVQVLYQSQRLYSNPGRRLLETGQYVLDVTAKDAFLPRGRAIRSIQKVRLVHAAIRYHINNSGHWNAESLGKPINQEDMGGTNLSMAMLPVRGLRKLKLNISLEDAEAYLHLWNVASYMLGVDERLLPDTAKEAYVFDRMIQERHHGPSEAGQMLTKALLNYIQTQVAGSAQIALPAYMRYLLGEQIAAYLAIPKYDLTGSMMIHAAKSMNQIRNIFPSLIIPVGGTPLAGRGAATPSFQSLYGSSLFAMPSGLMEKTAKF